MIQKAREYPLSDLIDFGRTKTIKCPFHNEKTPSFSYYEKGNMARCFGCGKVCDSISWIMTTQNKNFIEAVKQLN